MAGFSWCGDHQAPLSGRTINGPQICDYATCASCQPAPMLSNSSCCRVDTTSEVLVGMVLAAHAEAAPPALNCQRQLPGAHMRKSNPGARDLSPHSRVSCFGFLRRPRYSHCGKRPAVQLGVPCRRLLAGASPVAPGHGTKTAAATAFAS